jgi:hypothetical protein
MGTNRRLLLATPLRGKARRFAYLTTDTSPLTPTSIKDSNVHMNVHPHK